MCSLENNELQFEIILSANKTCHIMFCLLYCIIEDIQMTEGRIRPAGSILVSPVIAQRGVNIADAQLQ
jgi:hypothetical protein